MWNTTLLKHDTDVIPEMDRKILGEELCVPQAVRVVVHGRAPGALAARSGCT